MKVALYVAIALLAAAGIYGALNGASPGLTLATGIGVGVLWVIVTRQRENER